MKSVLVAVLAWYVAPGFIEIVAGRELDSQHFPKTRLL
jgi:hypothetical protein